MTTETVIDAAGLHEVEVGELIGNCNALVTGFDRGDVVAVVRPTPKDCQGCKLEDYCPECKAD